MNPGDSLPQRLRARLLRPLPARWGHKLFLPELAYGRHAGPIPQTARQAAVVLLLEWKEDRWQLPLILRPPHMTSHAGQIGLPGGAIEPGETTEEAGLRELTEELGVPTEFVEVLGMLSPAYVFASGFSVTPLVALARQSLHFTPAAAEVEEVIELPLLHLQDSKNWGEHKIIRGSRQFVAPHIAIGKHRIWGTTAIILGELSELLVEIDTE